ncbi:hypothetical protein AXG93_1544s1050 [Marchantia polymorpha subsp. ruderalis]|uniref:Uncharacterized protein n=1 Tax=Marchantia polymorpha subsp. ruderalis TaxID=1480154 RepID=A0A176VRY3_MARPO|nr:hypothetical protein AXG93_1544s1050 [Marchantia polymorpha subsp. ruderalis]
MGSSGAKASTSYEEKDFSYLASVAQVEALVAVTRGATCALEPHGTTMEWDPHRDEGGSQAKLSQSFLLSESRDRHMSVLPMRFISGARSLGSSSTVLASVAGFSGKLV